MSESLISSIVTVITAIIGVAILAVLVSKNADTANVVQAGGNSLSQLLGVAISPVTGSGFGGFSGGASSMPSMHF